MMEREGTFPENAYFVEFTQISSSQGTNTYEKSVQEELNKGEDDVEEPKDEIPEYESESDNEATSVKENDKEHVDSLKNVATFLVGSSCRFWRSINSKINILLN